MVSVLASSAVDRGFEYRSDQTKDYKIDQGKDLLDRNQNNVSEWSYMSTRGLLLQWASTTNIQLIVLV